MVLVAVAATFLDRDDGLALVFVVSGAAVGSLYLLGSDISVASASLPPLMLIAGYAALAGVLSASGLAKVMADRLGDGPVPVFLLAAAASVTLSNDIVVVALAPVVVQRAGRVVDSAALLVGANVTGALFPQGTPKNLMLLGADIPFFEYLAVSAPVTLVMTAVAWVFFALYSRASRSWSALGPPSGAPSSPEPMSSAHRALAAVAMCAIVAQALADMLGLSRAVFGWMLFSVALALGRYLGVPVSRVAGSVPWQLAPVVLVVVGAASVLVDDAGSGVVSAGIAAFFVSSLATDLVGAALAAPLVAEGALSAGLALAATTTAAYATPVGSVSAVLLLQRTSGAASRPELLTFVLSGAVAVVSFSASLALLPALQQILGR